MSEGIESTATIKFAGGHDAPWFVAKGYPREIRAQLIEVFGFDEAGVQEFTTGELIIQASQHAQATYQAASRLGAKPMPVDLPKAPSGPTGESAWAAAHNATDGFENAIENVQKAGLVPDAESDPLLAAIKNLTSMAEFRSLWVQNQHEWQRPEVANAAKAKAEELASA